MFRRGKKNKGLVKIQSMNDGSWRTDYIRPGNEYTYYIDLRGLGVPGDDTALVKVIFEDK